MTETNKRQLEALDAAVCILKKAAIDTISSTREAHTVAYNAYHYLAKQFQKEFGDFPTKLELYTGQLNIPIPPV